MTAEALLALVEEVGVLHARAEVARAMAGLSGSADEHEQFLHRAAHWDALVRERYSTLAGAVRAVLPATAGVGLFLPVRALSNGHVELYVQDSHGQRLVVLLSGGQAVAVGAHLTAHGAISLDRIGQKANDALPHVKAAPPLYRPATADQHNDAP